MPLNQEEYASLVNSLRGGATAPTSQDIDSDLLARARGEVQTQAEPSAFSRGMQQSFEGIKAIPAGIAKLIGDAAESETLRQYGTERLKKASEEMAKLARPTDEFGNVQSLSDFGSYLGHTFGMYTPDIVGALLSGGVGTYAAKRGATALAGQALTKEALKTVAKRGALGGATAYTTGRELGEIEQMQTEEGVSAPGRAAVGAGVAGALEVAFPYLFGRAIGVFPEPLYRTGGRLPAALKMGVLGAATEAGTEATQTVAERFGAAQPLTTPEALKDYYESAIAGAFGGGGFGAIGGATMRKAPEAPPLPPTQAEIDAQAQAQADLAQAAIVKRNVSEWSRDEALMAAPDIVGRVRMHMREFSTPALSKTITEKTTLQEVEALTAAIEQGYSIDNAKKLLKEQQALQKTATKLEQLQAAEKNTAGVEKQVAKIQANIAAIDVDKSGFEAQIADARAKMLALADTPVESARVEKQIAALETKRDKTHEAALKPLTALRDHMREYKQRALEEQTRRADTAIQEVAKQQQLQTETEAAYAALESEKQAELDALQAEQGPTRVRPDIRGRVRESRPVTTQALVDEVTGVSRERTGITKKDVEAAVGEPAGRVVDFERGQVERELTAADRAEMGIAAARQMPPLEILTTQKSALLPQEANAKVSAIKQVVEQTGIPAKEQDIQFIAKQSEETLNEYIVKQEKSKRPPSARADLATAFAEAIQRVRVRVPQAQEAQNAVQEQVTDSRVLRQAETRGQEGQVEVQPMAERDTEPQQAAEAVPAQEVGLREQLGERLQRAFDENAIDNATYLDLKNTLPKVGDAALDVFVTTMTRRGVPAYAPAPTTAPVARKTIFERAREANQKFYMSQPALATEDLQVIEDALQNNNLEQYGFADRAEALRYAENSVAVAEANLAKLKGVEALATALHGHKAYGPTDGARLMADIAGLTNKLSAELAKVVGVRKEVVLQVLPELALEHQVGEAKIQMLDGKFFRALVEISFKATNPLSTTQHEGMHLAEELGLLTASEVKILERGLRKGTAIRAQLDHEARMDDLKDGSSVELAMRADKKEVRAYGFQYYMAGRLKPTGTIAKIFARIKAFFERVGNAWNKLGFKSAQDVFEIVKQGRLAQRHLDVNKINVGTQRFAGTTNKATYTPERIDSLLSKYADGDNQNNTQAYVTYMSPDEFIDLTTNIKARAIVESQVTPLDIDRLRAESEELMLFISNPFIEGDTEAQVVSHEGRHRILALKKAGVSRVPVTLYFMQGKQVTPVAEATLKRQGDGAKSVKVHDLEPLSYANEETIKQKFTGVESSVQFAQGPTIDEPIEGSIENLQRHLDTVEFEKFPPAKTLFGAGAKEALSSIRDLYHRYGMTLTGVERISKAFKYVSHALQERRSYTDQLAVRMREIAPSLFEGEFVRRGDELTQKVTVGLIRARQQAAAFTTATELADAVGLPMSEAAEAFTLYKDMRNAIRYGLHMANVADKVFYAQTFGRDSETYTELAAKADERLTMALATEYFPARRWGEYAIPVYIKGAESEGVVFYAQATNRARARVITDTLNQYLQDNGLADQLEVGGISHVKPAQTALYQQMNIYDFLEIAKQNNIELPQKSLEGVVKALVDIEDLTRNRYMQWEDVPGWSRNGPRVVAEFIVHDASRLSSAVYNNRIRDAFMGYGIGEPEMAQRAELRDKFKGVDDIALRSKLLDDVVKGNIDAEADLLEYYEWRRLEAKPELPDGVQTTWRQDGVQGETFHTAADDLIRYTFSSKAYPAVSAMRALAAFMFLGGNISAMVVNLTATPLITTPYLVQLGLSPSEAMSLALNKMKLATKLIFHNKAWRQTNDNFLRNPAKLDDALQGLDFDPDLTKALRNALEDGTIAESLAYGIFGESSGSIRMYNTTARKALDGWMAPFRLSEQTNRITAFLAAYEVGKRQGLQGDKLYGYARDAVRYTQGVYGRLSLPGAARSSIGLLLMTFRQYPLMMTELLAHMGIHGGAEGKRAAAMMLGMLLLAGGLGGLPGEEDLEDLIDTVWIRIFDSPFSTRRWLKNTIKTASEATTGMDMSGVLVHGLVNSAFNVNLSSRISLANLVPGTAIGIPGEGVGKAAEEILGPVMAEIKGFTTGATKVAQTTARAATGDIALAGESLKEAGTEAAPVGLRNLFRGAKELSTGEVRTATGALVGPVTSTGAIMHALGFAPADLAEAYDSVRGVSREVAFLREYRADIKNAIIRALNSGDDARVRELYEFVQTWDMAHPGQRFELDGKEIRKALIQANMPITQRTLQKLPKRWQSTYAEDLEETE